MSALIFATDVRVALDRLDRRAPDHRHVIARILVLAQQLAHLELHQVQQLGIVHQVALVQEHHDRRHVHLARQQDVLARLRHRAVHRAHHQDRPVHLRGPGDHVLDVVGVPRAVDVGVVPLRRLVLDVARRDRQDLGRVAAALRFRRLRHGIVRDVLRRKARVGRHLRQRRRQRRLAVIDVPDRPDVHVRLGPLELDLRHVPVLDPVV